MTDTSKLLGNLTSWIKAPKALEKLAKLPLETKRAIVYPRVIKLAVEYWTDKQKGGSGLEVENFVKFIVGELAVEPDLANKVFIALAKNPIQVRPEHFYKLVAESRDQRAVPLMKHMWKAHRFQWAGAALALDASELGDDVAAVLAQMPTGNEMEVSLAAGTLGGTKAIAELKKQSNTSFVSRMDCIALALALAGHDDATYFKKLGRGGEGQTAKRLHAVLHAPKPQDRITALDGFTKHVEKPKAWITIGMLLAFSRMLIADDPLVAERGAAMITTYLDARLPNVRRNPQPWHAYFLRSAQTAITRGVPKPMRATLDAIRKSIPHSEAFTDP